MSLFNDIRQVGFVNHLKSPFNLPSHNFVMTTKNKVAILAASLFSAIAAAFIASWNSWTKAKTIGFLTGFFIGSLYTIALIYKLIIIKQRAVVIVNEITPEDKHLFEAVNRNDATSVKALFQDNKKALNVNTVIVSSNTVGQEVRRTPLHQACIHGNEEIALLLLEKGASPCETDNLNRNAAHWAAEKGLSNVINRLLSDEKADFNAYDSVGNIPLFLAVNNKFPELALALINSNKMDVKKAHRDTGMTALHMACARGYSQLIAPLVQACADVNAVDVRGRTPLDNAFECGDSSTIASLLKAGAIITKCQEKGLAALRQALDKGTQYQEKSLAAFLLENDVPFEWKGPNGTTLLHLACSSKLFDAAKILTEKAKHLINEVNKNASTPLMNACAAGCEPISLNLINENHADVKPVNLAGYSALHYAAENGLEETVRSLIIKGADVHVKTAYAHVNDSCTPIELTFGALKFELANKTSQDKDKVKKLSNVAHQLIQAGATAPEGLTPLLAI